LIFETTKDWSQFLFGSFEITSIRLYTPCCGLRKDVYNLIEVISNEPNKNCDQSL
jgi:hypothetical protein